MGGPRPGLVIAAVGAASILVGMALTIDAPAAEAKKDKTGVACPKKVGPYKLAETKVREDNSQVCDYHQPKHSGWAFLTVRWHADEPGERRRCASREPHFTVDGSGADLDSAGHMIEGHVSISHPDDMSIASAEKPLRKLLAATEALAHPCVPAVPAEPAEGPSCPLLLPHDLVRSDWYFGETQVAEARGDGSSDRYFLKCKYQPAYVEDGDAVVVEVEWKEGDPSHPTLCRVREKEFYGETEYQLGYHPVSVRTSDEFVERWDGQAIADALVAAAAARTRPCPDAPDGPAPYEVDSAEPDTATTTTTTIVLSGGPGEEPPPLGATVPMPEDDQHRVVIGGLDGEVIREEFLGDQATIIGYGPMATDADGNWSVSVDVEASTAPTPPPAPASPLPSAASPSALPSEAPSSVPAPSEEPSPPPTASPLPAPSATPSAVPSPKPSPTPDPALPPTAVPPPEMIGIPEVVAEYVAGLEPKAAGAVRDLTDYLGALGDELIQEGAGEVTIPASDLASLRLLAPGFVDEIRLVSGGIIVDSVVDVRVTPVIGEDGLIEFRTNRLQDRIRSHEIVKALVLALNNYVVESGGRFRTISVTPEGLTVTAERAPQE